MAKRPRKPKPEDGPPSPPASSVLPMQLQVGDRFADETGKWEIVSRPATTVGGKTVRARVQKVSEPAITEERVWSAYEKVVHAARRRRGAAMSCTRRVKATQSVVSFLSEDERAYNG